MLTLPAITLLCKRTPKRLISIKYNLVPISQPFPICPFLLPSQPVVSASAFNFMKLPIFQTWHMSEIMWHLSFCAWLILLNVNSTSIRVVVNEDFAHFPCWVVFHCAYVPHFIYPSVERHLGWFHFLALVTCAAGDMGLQMSLCQTDFISLGSRPRSGVAGSYGSSIFSFGRISILSSKMTLFYLYFKRFIYLKGRITERERHGKR